MPALPEENKQSLTPSAARLKIRSYCAYRERSQHEVRQKLYAYGLHSEDVELLLSEVIEEDFVNEERFARALVRGKFYIKKWGRVKIIGALNLHKISTYLRQKALEEIDEDDYQRTLQKLLKVKSRQIKGSNAFQRKGKLAQYALSKGYENELIWEVLNAEQ